MQINELRKWQKHQPFEPFEILLVDGRRFPVPHPDFLLIPPRPGAWVYVADGSGTADHINTAVISSIGKAHSNGE